MFMPAISILMALGMMTPLGRPPVSTPADASVTLGDLQIAYNLERNAERQYTVYATAADREGYHKVACLFRAAARGERIHASNHAVAIRELGAEPEANIEVVFIRSTRSNLRRAIAEEEYERDHMYRMFSGQARRDGYTVAAASLTRARDAEGTHAALFRRAADNLEAMKRDEYFCVCPECGSVARAVEARQCWTCGTPPGGFEQVN